jgi:NAD(P)-dependent dehydrogenase (short-subunit alcohol dehydrogenase family)
MMKVLEHKKAVITGGSDGIGFAIAKAFARNGADILLVARNQEKLEKAVSELSALGTNVKTLSCDLSAVDSVQDVANNILTIFPDIDVLVNNAGVAKFTPFEQITLQELDYQLNVNVKAVFLLIQSLLTSLKKNKASIINISSFHAQRAMPGIPAAGYALTKGAINTLTKTLAYEMGPSGVRINAIAPGNVLTAKVKAYMANIPEQDKARFQQMITTLYPLGRVGEPEELGDIAVYLASDQASWVTGSIINVDGGLTTN